MASPQDSNPRNNEHDAAHQNQFAQSDGPIPPGQRYYTHHFYYDPYHYYYHVPLHGNDGDEYVVVTPIPVEGFDGAGDDVQVDDRMIRRYHMRLAAGNNSNNNNSSSSSNNNNAPSVERAPRELPLFDVRPRDQREAATGGVAVADVAEEAAPAGWGLDLTLEVGPPTRVHRRRHHHHHHHYAAAPYNARSETEVRRRRHHHSVAPDNARSEAASSRAGVREFRLFGARAPPDQTATTSRRPREFRLFGARAPPDQGATTSGPRDDVRELRLFGARAPPDQGAATSRSRDDVRELRLFGARVRPDQGATTTSRGDVGEEVPDRFDGSMLELSLKPPGWR